MTHLHSRFETEGFTMIEILVAMVVLAIGLLGMAGMTVVVMRGNRGAVEMTAATGICQKKIEELKNLDWDEVGNWPIADWDNAVVAGAEKAGMVQEGSVETGQGLNSQGLTQQDFFIQENTVSSSPCEGLYEGGSWDASTDDCKEHIQDAGPYKFARTFVVCRGDDYDGSGNPLADSVPKATPIPDVFRGEFEPECRVDPKMNSSRTKSVGCLPADITTAPGAGNTEKKLKAMCAWRDSQGACHAINVETTIVKF
jgi:prepilin-type N-terminal cleavage/methylation domain-containing protein